MFACLTSLTSGDANSVVRNRGDIQGLEAWRGLHNEYDPASSMRKATILGDVQNLTKCDSLLTSDSTCERESLPLEYCQVCAVSHMELVHPGHLLLASDTGVPPHDQYVVVDRQEPHFPSVLDGRDMVVQQEPHLFGGGASDLTIGGIENLMELLIAVGDEIHNRGEDPQLGEMVDQWSPAAHPIGARQCAIQDPVFGPPHAEELFFPAC